MKGELKYYYNFNRSVLLCEKLHGIDYVHYVTKSKISIEDVWNFIGGCEDYMPLWTRHSTMRKGDFPLYIHRHGYKLIYPIPLKDKIDLI
jgi:predicted oxidoreductase